MVKFLVLGVLITLSFRSVAEQKCDDTGCYNKCSDNTGCTAPLGCYKMTAEDFEGATWQNVAAGLTKDNGSHCSSDFLCKSGNCEWRCDEYKKDDNGNTTSECKTEHHECADLKVCRKGQTGDTLADSTRLCDQGLISSNNKCIVVSSIPAFADEGTDSTISEVTIDPHSCTVKVPAAMNANYRYNIYMTQLLEFLFEDPQFGDDADCIQTTIGIRHISNNLKTARHAYSDGVIQGLREQEDKFHSDLENNVDLTKKNSVDLYTKSLEIMIANQKKYKEGNTSMLEAYKVAQGDISLINEYYFGFDWGDDATGDTPNRTRIYTLADGWHRGVRDPSGENYCRGRSPYMKNSWKRRYRQEGTPIDLAYYLQLQVPSNNDSGWNQFWDGIGDSITHSPELMFLGPSAVIINSLIQNFSRDVFVLDPVLPTNGISGDYFGKFGQTDIWNTFDGDVRQLLNGNTNSHATKSVNGMLDYYVGFLYKKFKNDPTILGKINDSNKPKIEVIASKVANPAWAATFFTPGLKNVEISAEDAKKKYFLNADSQGRYSLNENLKKFLDEVLALNFSTDSLKHVVQFHKLIWDFRQRMYLIQYLYSASGGRRHPVQQRGTFFETFNAIFDYNANYLTELNKGHDKAITCLENLKVTYQAAVAPDGTVVSSATNYNTTSHGNAGVVSNTTQQQSNCKGDKCKETSITANLNIPTFNTNTGKDSGKGVVKDGNLQSSKLSVIDNRLKAIADSRKKRSDEFFKTAGPAAKKAVENNRNFIKSILAIPPVIASGLVLSSHSGTESSSGTNTNQTNTPNPKSDQTNKAASLAKPPGPNLQLNSDSKGFFGIGPGETPNSLISSEEAEQMIQESKKDEYKDNDSDSIFSKISKGYIRAGIPRLLKKKVYSHPQEHDEFHIEKTKKR